MLCNVFVNNINVINISFILSNNNILVVLFVSLIEEIFQLIKTSIYCWFLTNHTSFLLSISKGCCFFFLVIQYMQQSSMKYFQTVEKITNNHKDNKRLPSIKQWVWMHLRNIYYNSCLLWLVSSFMSHVWKIKHIHHPNPQRSKRDLLIFFKMVLGHPVLANWARSWQRQCKKASDSWHHEFH